MNSSSGIIGLLFVNFLDGNVSVWAVARMDIGSW